MNRLPDNCVRGRIRRYIERHADKLGGDVLEIGSRMTNPSTWWIVNRDLAMGQWTGMDMQPGHGVDVVADMHNLPPEWAGRFSGVLCSEVLEHVARPWVALPKLRAVIRPGGWAIFTTLFAFPEHGFPDDYYRYSQSGLRLLLEDAHQQSGLRACYAKVFHDNTASRPALEKLGFDALDICPAPPNADEMFYRWGGAQSRENSVEELRTLFERMGAETRVAMPLSLSDARRRS